jgi:hypothetical protein
VAKRDRLVLGIAVVVLSWRGIKIIQVKREEMPNKRRFWRRKRKKSAFLKTRIKQRRHQQWWKRLKR